MRWCRGLVHWQPANELAGDKLHSRNLFSSMMIISVKRLAIEPRVRGVLNLVPLCPALRTGLFRFNHSVIVQIAVFLISLPYRIKYIHRKQLPQEANIIARDVSCRIHSPKTASVGSTSYSRGRKTLVKKKVAQSSVGTK